MIDVEALKRFLATELFERLVEFYTYSPTTLPRPDFKSVYSWLREVEEEFFQHPAKMSPWLAAILWRSVEADDTVLDPMCGVGGTVIPGLLLNPPRKVVLNDIVPEYVEVARKVCESVVKELGFNTRVEAYTANAATLYERVGRRSVDIIITSPPYGAMRASTYHPYRKEYRGGGWGDLATFNNGHYSVAWLQLIAGFYLTLDQGGKCLINIKNTRTHKQKLPPLSEITARHMEYVGFQRISREEFLLTYESPYVRGRRVRGESIDHLLREYVIRGVKP